MGNENVNEKVRSQQESEKQRETDICTHDDHIGAYLLTISTKHTASGVGENNR